MSRAARLFPRTTSRPRPIIINRRNSPPSCSSSSLFLQTRIRRLARSILKTLRTCKSKPNSELEHCLDDLFSSHYQLYDDGDDNTASTATSTVVSEAITLVLSRIHDLDSALAFFGWAYRRRPETVDSLSYSAILKLLVRSRRFSEIELVLEDMKEEVRDPTPQVFGDLVAAYSRSGLLEKALQLYSAAKDQGISFPDASGCNCLLYLLVKRRRFEMARQVYDEMLKREGGADNQSTCIMVGGLCSDGRMDEAWKLIEDRWGDGCIPNVVFYNTLMDGYCKHGDVRRAYRLFREMEQKGFLPTLVSFGVLINGFSKTCNFTEIRRLFSAMRARGLSPNAEIYNSLINANCKHGSIFEAKAVLRQMIGSGCELDIVTYNTLISGYCRNGKVKEAEHLLREAMRGGRLVPNEFSYTPLIHRYCQEGDVLTASNFLIEMIGRGLSPDLVTYGALVHGLVNAGEVKESLTVKEKLMERGMTPDAAIYNVLISGLCKKGMLPAAKSLLSEMFDQNILPDEFLYATLVDGFIRNGDLGEAKKVFRFMEEKKIMPGIVGYNAMVKGYCKFGLMNDATTCINKMRKGGVCPDEFTYTTLIDGYVKQNDVNGALRVFSDMFKRRCKPNVVTYSALINGFCRQGDFARAEKLVMEMRSSGLDPNVVTYSTLIGNYCKAGNLERATMYFEEMLHARCYPNDITFHFLINGLTHSIPSLRATEGGALYRESECLLLDVFKNLISDEWDARTAAYNAIISCLCGNRMFKLALELRDNMVRKGFAACTLTFVFLLHGLFLEGRSREWKGILPCSLDCPELQIALKYTVLLDRHLNQGALSEASRIVYSLLEEHQTFNNAENVTV